MCISNCSNVADDDNNGDNDHGHEWIVKIGIVST